MPKVTLPGQLTAQLYMIMITAWVNNCNYN
jgi:hypothetical protein